jgi:hypothetical protein
VNVDLTDEQELIRHAVREEVIDQLAGLRTSSAVHR